MVVISWWLCSLLGPPVLSFGFQRGSPHLWKELARYSVAYSLAGILVAVAWAGLLSIKNEAVFVVVDSIVHQVEHALTLASTLVFPMVVGLKAAEFLSSYPE